MCTSATAGPSRRSRRPSHSLRRTHAVWLAELPYILVCTVLCNVQVSSEFSCNDSMTAMPNAVRLKTSTTKRTILPCSYLDQFEWRKTAILRTEGVLAQSQRICSWVSGDMPFQKAYTESGLPGISRSCRKTRVCYAAEGKQGYDTTAG